MRIPTRSSVDPEALPGLSAPVRVGRRAGEVARRLRPGEIAVVDHMDLDRVSAEELVAAGVAAVVNAEPSTSGRYPNLGPEVLVSAGVPLVDAVGPHLLDRVRDGDVLRVDGSAVYRDRGDESTLLAAGERQTPRSVAARLAEARTGLAGQLQALAANTADFLARDGGLLLNGVGLPRLATALAGRHVVVVVRGYDDAEDLAGLHAYIAECEPVLVGVDDGADVLLRGGYRPHIVLGALDTVSERALRSGAELVLHAPHGDAGPGRQRLEHLGLAAADVTCAGNSEDVAMLLADAAGATLIVAVGAHTSLTELLDKGRDGMASSFLTRLRISGTLVDARAASQLFRSRVSTWAARLLVALGVVAVLLAMAVTPVGQDAIASVGDGWDRLLTWLWGLRS